MSRGNYCDPLSCEHATFPEIDALDGACRREVSLRCALFDRLVPKHARCLADKGHTPSDPKSEGSPSTS